MMMNSGLIGSWIELYGGCVWRLIVRADWIIWIGFALMGVMVSDDLHSCGFLVALQA